MKLDHFKSDVVIRVVAHDVDQRCVAGLACPHSKRQLIMSRVHSFHLVDRVRQYSTSVPAAFQTRDVTAELVRHSVCIRHCQNQR